jgi:hypothetical protein
MENMYAKVQGNDIFNKIMRKLIRTVLTAIHKIVPKTINRVHHHQALNPAVVMLLMKTKTFTPNFNVSTAKRNINHRNH